MNTRVRSRLAVVGCGFLGACLASASDPPSDAPPPPPPPLFIELHGPTTQIIYVNARQITSVRTPLDVKTQHFVEGTQCIIVMTNRNFIAVRDKCLEVMRKIVALTPAERR